MTKYKLNLFLFDNTQKTTTEDLTPGMRTFYHDRVLDNAQPYLIHAQFGNLYSIPKHGGKTIEFRKYVPLDKALTPLTEGVAPSGNSLRLQTINATIDQYGDYIEVSDLLEFTMIDSAMEEANILLGAQLGQTLDTVVREVMQGGSNRIFADSVSGSTVTPVLARANITKDCLLTPKAIRTAVTKLKQQNVQKIKGDYVGIIHPDVASDLMANTEWVEAHKYANPESIYEGEIGKLYGVRFVETTEAKIIGPANMLGIVGYNRTTLNAAVENSVDIYPVDVFTTTQATAINAAIGEGAEYKIYVDGTECVVASVTGGAKATCKITLSDAITAAKDDIVCGAGAGSDGSAIYCTLIVGLNAYARTDLAGEAVKHIIKQLGSAGTGDPLDQIATVGWKASLVAERLAEQNMIRIEHSSADFGHVQLSN